MTDEVVTTDLDADQAREITDKINGHLAGLWTLVVAAWTGRVWLALGYGSWDAWCEGEIKTGHLRIPGEERVEVVGTLRQAGMSTRAIASATGMSKDTVNRVPGVSDETPQTIIGTDGKAYSSSGSGRPRQRVKSHAERDIETDDKIRLQEAQGLYHRLVARGLRVDNGEPIFGRLFHEVTRIMPVETGVHPEMFIGMVEQMTKYGGPSYPVVVHPDDGSVIDGRLRLIACEFAGVTPMFVDLPDRHVKRGIDGVWSYWTSANMLGRQHLTRSQMKEVNQKWQAENLDGAMPYPWVERDDEPTG